MAKAARVSDDNIIKFMGVLVNATETKEWEQGEIDLAFDMISSMLSVRQTDILDKLYNKAKG